MFELKTTLLCDFHHDYNYAIVICINLVHNSKSREYCTIVVLHGICGIQKIGWYRKAILWYDYFTGILRSTSL